MPESDLVPLPEGIDSARVLAFAEALQIEATMDAGAKTAVFQIMDAILAAGTAEEVFKAADAGTLSGKDYIDQPFRLAAGDWDWKASAPKYRESNGWPFYALCRIGDLMTGEKSVLSCGGFSFCTTLWRLNQLTAEQGGFDAYTEDGGMPLVIKGKEAGAGTVLLLSPYRLPAAKK